MSKRVPKNAVKIVEERFRPGFELLSDEELMAPPPRVFSRLKMFTSSYETTIKNIYVEPERLIELIEPTGPILAINCNFGHKYQEGYKMYVKDAPRTMKNSRRKQGNGTSFNCSVEPVVRIDTEGIPEDKVYKLKCFPTTGKTQVPGVIFEDVRDGRRAIQLWVDFLRMSEVGTSSSEPISFSEGRIFMRNFKFSLNRSCPRMMIQKRALVRFLEANEFDFAYKIGGIETQRSSGLSFSCLDEESERSIKVKMFVKGKVNILGGITMEHGRNIYSFLEKIFRENWAEFITLEPKPDVDAANEEKPKKEKTSRKKSAGRMPAETQAKTQAETQAKTQAKTRAETRAETQAETRAETRAEKSTGDVVDDSPKNGYDSMSDVSLDELDL